jgi:hypothetical protein
MAPDATGLPRTNSGSLGAAIRWHASPQHEPCESTGTAISLEEQQGGAAEQTPATAIIIASTLRGKESRTILEKLYFRLPGSA